MKFSANHDWNIPTIPVILLRSCSHIEVGDTAGVKTSRDDKKCDLFSKSGKISVVTIRLEVRLILEWIICDFLQIFLEAFNEISN